MGPDSILAKTDKGAEEIATRKYKLDAKLRTVLIMVNGSSSVADLTKKFAGLDLQPMLAQLQREGYVKESSGAAAAGGAAAGDIKKVRMEVARALTDILGPGAESMAIKIEGCATMDELRSYLEGRRESLSSALGRRAADFWAKVDGLTRA